jgi:signal transduction histidine kinase
VKNGSDDEVGEVSNAFNIMAEQLEKKENSRKRLLADIAHELRNPLSIVQGNLEAWLDGVITPTPEQFASVYDETVLLNRLITDLRELSLAEAGQLKLHLESINIGDLINGEVSVFQARCQDKQVSLSAGIAPDLPERSLDRDRIRQVLHNLLENALRYTSSDGSIRVSAGKNQQGKVVISVSDTGSGIAPADLPYVFDHFYKADKSRQRGYGGAGIGLALVKKYVELHGGNIRVESEPGKGSTFSFEL